MMAWWLALVLVVDVAPKLFLAGRSEDRPVFLSKAKREGPHSGPSGKINGMERGIIGMRPISYISAGPGADVRSHESQLLIYARDRHPA